MRSLGPEFFVELFGFTFLIYDASPDNVFLCGLAGSAGSRFEEFVFEQAAGPISVDRTYHVKVQLVVGHTEVPLFPEPPEPCVPGQVAECRPLGMIEKVFQPLGDLDLVASPIGAIVKVTQPSGSITCEV